MVASGASPVPKGCQGKNKWPRGALEGFRVPRLTEQEWKRLVPLLKNIDINRQQAAYGRLVRGLTLVKAGEPFGYSMQDVHYIVKTVMRWWEKLNSLPDKPLPPRGWVAIELVVPRKHVDEVRRVVEA